MNNGTASLPLRMALGIFSWALLTQPWTSPVEAAQELTLEQALDLALTHSPVLKASQHDVQAAAAQRRIAVSGFLPKVDVSETYFNTNNPAQAFGILLNQGRFTAADFNPATLNSPGTTENWQFNANLVQPVYNGGREQLNLTLAEIGEVASHESAEHARQRILFHVTRAYYEQVLAKAVLDVARETVQIAEANVKQIRSRYQAGTTVKSDVLQAEVRLASLREEAIRADQVVRVTTIALRHAIGLDDEVDATESLAPRGRDEPSLDRAVQTALETRPDYRALQAEAQKADVGIQLAKSAYFPTLNLQAGYQLNNTAPFSPNGANNYSALGILTFNLFNGLGDSAQVGKARAHQDRARELLEAKRREIEVEVVEASYGLAAARERIAVSESAIAQAEENLRIVRNRYNAGIVSVLDLLTAELVLNQAKQNRLRALYDEHVGHSKIELVTGLFGAAASDVRR